MTSINVISLLKRIDAAQIVGSLEIHDLFKFLTETANRAVELDDPKLNALMCRMALYAIADPDSPQYDIDRVAAVIRMGSSELSFGQKLRAERIRTGMSQPDIAAQAEITPRQYRKWESDEVTPAEAFQEGMLARLARVSSQKGAVK